MTTFDADFGTSTGIKVLLFAFTSPFTEWVIPTYIEVS